MPLDALDDPDRSTELERESISLGEVDRAGRLEMRNVGAGNGIDVVVRGKTAMGRRLAEGDAASLLELLVHGFATARRPRLTQVIGGLRARWRKDGLELSISRQARLLLPDADVELLRDWLEQLVRRHAYQLSPEGLEALRLRRLEVSSRLVVTDAHVQAVAAAVRRAEAHDPRCTSAPASADAIQAAVEWARERRGMIVPRDLIAF